MKRIYAFYTMGKTTLAKKYKLADEDRFYRHPIMFGRSNIVLTNQLSSFVDLIVLPENLETVYKRLKGALKEESFNEYKNLLENEYKRAKTSKLPILYLKDNQYLENIKGEIL